MWLRAGELNATRMAYEASMTPVHLPAEKLVREAGVEPAASRLSVECSNRAELFPVVLRTQRVEPRARFELAFPDYRSGASPTMLTGPANSGANGANRTLIGCLPCNCSPVELHRLGARGGIRNPDLRVTDAALFHLNYSGASKDVWSECGESNSVDQTGDPMPNQ